MGNMPLQQLIEQGFMFVPVDESLIQAANTSWRAFIEEEKDSKVGFPITRRGESSPDLGHIIRNGDNGGDIKHFLHLAHDFCRLLSDAGRKDFGAHYGSMYVSLDALRKHLDDVSIQIARQLDKKYSSLFREPLTPNMLRCSKNSIPYATPTLRTLLYPSEPRQTGARVHIDRSFITLHVGDKGGTLLGCDGEFGNSFSISPSQGEAAVFFGVKVLHLTEGRIFPLWHKSTVEPNQDREATVHFAHADIGIDVVDARATYNEFFETRER
jgi:isopenicillin N synthase-like dioxygenase